MSVENLDTLLDKARTYAKFMETDLNIAAPNSKDSLAATGELPEHLKDIQQPALLQNGTLKSYQLLGVHWLIQLYKNGANGILADEMGLGKTVQTIGILAHLWERKCYGPFLIVAPLSTLSNWKAELEKWCPSLIPLCYHGPKKERHRMQTDFKKRYAKGQSKKKYMKKVPVVITSYEIATRDSSFLGKFHWRYLVVDEAHRLKNFECLLIRELRALDSQNRLLLTGTPLQNNLSELWSLLNFVLPDVFDSLDNFKQWFDIDTMLDDFNKPTDSLLANIVRKLHLIIRPFMLRRLKSEVEAINIPQKKELFLYCSFADEQKAFYNLLISKDWGALGNKARRISARNVFMQLRKCCNHPFLFDEAFDVFRAKYIRAKKEGKDIKILVEEELAILEAEKDDQDFVERGRLRKRKRIDYTDAAVFADIDKILKKSSISNESNHVEKIIDPELPDGENAPIKARSARIMFLADKSKEVAANLKKDEDILSAVHRLWVDLNDADKKKYDSLAKSDKLRYEREMMAYMRKYHTDMVIKDPKAYLQSIVECSGKMNILNRMLPRLKERGHKVLIFSQMTRILDILEDYVELSGYNYCRIDGSTKQEDRESKIEAFNSNDDIFIFLLSTRAGGLGINLTSADTVFIYDSDFNPQMDLQAQDRVHRLGQTRPVCIFRLATASSAESRVLQLAMKKLKLDRLVAVDRKKIGLEEKEVFEILAEDLSRGVFGSQAGITDEQLELLLDREKVMSINSLEKSEENEENSMGELLDGFQVVPTNKADF